MTTFSYKIGDIEDKGNFLVGDSVTTAYFNNVYGAALRADMEQNRSKNESNPVLMNYWQRHNTQEVYIDETMTAMDANCSVSADSNINLFNKTAQKINVDVVTADHYSGSYVTGLSLDLTSFEDSNAASTTDDGIVWGIHVSDTANFDYIGIRIGTDASNYFYYYIYAVNHNNGYNHFFVQKSDFAEQGSPDWSTIDYFAVRYHTSDDCQNETITPIFVQMIRVDDSDVPVPRLTPNGSGTLEHDYGSPLSYLVLKKCDNRKLGFARLIASESSEMMRLTAQTSLKSYSSVLMYPLQDDGTAALTFRIDSDNYVETYVSNNTFYLRVTESGSVTATASIALTNSIEKHRQVKLSLEMNQPDIRALIHVYGEEHLLYNTTSLTDEGNIVISQVDSYSFGQITDWYVSNERKELTQYPLLVTPKESVNYSNSVIGDTDLVGYFEPNGMYKVEFNLTMVSDIAGHVVFDWSLSGDVSQNTTKVCIGMGISATAADDANYMRTSRHNLTTDVRYAIETSTYSNVLEEAFVTTKSQGGQITLRIRNYSGETITLSQSSFMTITKLNT